MSMEPPVKEKCGYWVCGAWVLDHEQWEAARDYWLSTLER